MKMRIREKTTAILLIAIFMVSVFSVAVSALSPDGMYTSGAAIVEPSTEQSYSGDHSFKHVATGEFDEASIFFDYGGTLGSITSVSYYSYVLSGASGLLHPYVYLKVNTGSGFAWVVQWETSATEPSGLGTWVQTTFDDDTLIHVPGGPGGYGQPATKTLGELKLVSGWSAYTVEKIYIELGQFTGAETITAYVDDVTINDLLYDFEPRASTSMESVVIDPIISIMVDPTQIDFGIITRGQDSATVPVTVTNTGEVSVDIDTEIVGANPTFYELYLYEDGNPITAYTATLAVDANDVLSLTLKPPLSAPVGEFDATLIFWATES